MFTSSRHCDVPVSAGGTEKGGNPGPPLSGYAPATCDMSELEIGLRIEVQYVFGKDYN